MEFTQGINNLFNTVKGKLQYSCPDSYYSPKIFNIFGDYDLAIISLIDDFDFALRTFTPFNPDFVDPDKKDDTGSAFEHQILLTSIVRSSLDKNVTNNQSNPLDHFWKPLLVITKIKLSSYFLMELGAQFIENVVDIIEIELSNIKEEKNWFVLRSYSWHELTIVCTAHEYEPILDVIKKIRGYSFSDLIGKKIVDPSSRDEVKKIYEIEDSHYIIKITHTTYGFCSDLNSQNDTNVKIYNITRLLAKGGKLNFIGNLILKSFPGQLSVKYSIGKSDLVITPARHEGISIKDFIKLIDIVSNQLNGSIISFNSFLLSNSSLCTDTDEPSKPKVKEYNHFINSLQFSPARIKVIIDNLRSKAIVKLLRDGIVNVYGEFNCGITDPILYSNFFEQFRFLNFLEEKLSRIHNIKKIALRNDYVEKVLNYFSISYNNRFQQSFIMNDITDNNIFFKGGVQNLLSAYSFISDLYTESINMEPLILYIQGHSDIKSDSMRISLNYIHITQPAIVIHHIVYEATLVFIHRLAEEQSNPGNLSFVNDEDLSIISEYLNEMLWHQKKIDESGELSRNIVKLLFLNAENDEPNKNEYFQYRAEVLEAICHASFFSHLAADLIIFNVLFKVDNPEDFKNLLFLYSTLFVSYSTSTDKINHFDKNKLIVFACRLSLLSIVTKNNDYTTNSKYFANFIIEDEQKKLFEIIHCNLSRFFEKFSREPEFKRFITAINKVCKYISSSVQNIDYNTSTESGQPNFEDVKLLFLEKINAIRKEWFDGGEEDFSLRRDAINGSPERSASDRTIFVDQMGGFFVSNGDARISFLDLRLKMIEELLDLNYKYKFHQLAEYLGG